MYKFMVVAAALLVAGCSGPPQTEQERIEELAKLATGKWDGALTLVSVQRRGEHLCGKVMANFTDPPTEVPFYLVDGPHMHIPGTDGFLPAYLERCRSGSQLPSRY